MRMTPTVILVGILSLLAAITLTVVYWPYAKRNVTPSEIFRQRSAVEAEGRKIYLENGCVYCHSQSLSLIHISEPTRPILVSRMPSSA